MKLTRSVSLALFLAPAFLLAPLTAAHDDHHEQPPSAASAAGRGELVPVGPATDATWLAAAREHYSLTTCVVSEEDLAAETMGPPREFIYRQAGQPDRLVRFCCKDCLKDFNREPAKYLRMLDDAAPQSHAR